MDAATWKRARDLLGDALELPPAEREAYLASRCSDPALLAEIRALLAEYESAPSFLEHPPPLVGFDQDEDDGLEPGSQVGPYVIIDRLGRGGMGQVWLGNDRRLKRKVALKRLLPSPSGGADERARILREARAAARINHTNVATIHDVIEYDGRVFIVMEYVEGESLAARLRRESRLPVAVALSIGRQLAAGLAAAHASGVIHRDLKPGNIQVSLDGAVKILDFGIAQSSLPLTSADSTRTTPATLDLDLRVMFAGTPEYMSPEQVVGGPVDERSDLFSLGVVLFEMLAGRRPFARDHAIERRDDGRVVAPRVDAANPAVPAALADVIASALEIDPRRRYESALAIGAALDALDRDIATAGDAAAPPRRAVRAAPWAIALVATPAVLLALGFMATGAFNITLHRAGPFARFAADSTLDYPMWAVRSLIPAAYDIVLAVIAVQAVAFALRVARLWPWCARLQSGFGAAARRFMQSLRLDDPPAMAQALAAAALLSLAVVWWAFADLIAAWQADINSSPAAVLAPLDPGNEARHNAYVIVLHLLALGFGVALFRIRRRRTRTGATGGGGAMLIVGAIVAVFVLMFVWPYRIMWQNAFERADAGGERCYVIGEAGDDLLLHCPDTAPPRNRIVKRDDPAVRRLGVVENIFTPPEKAPR